MAPLDSSIIGLAGTASPNNLYTTPSPGPVPAGFMTTPAAPTTVTTVMWQEKAAAEQASIADFTARRVAEKEAVKAAPRVSNRKARAMLTEAIITALRTRPDDFVEQSRDMDGDLRRVQDKKTGQIWDAFMGEMRSSNYCDCSERQLRLGFFQRMRVYFAFSKWDQMRTGGRMDPRQEEAIKLQLANAEGA